MIRRDFFQNITNTLAGLLALPAFVGQTLAGVLSALDRNVITIKQEAPARIEKKIRFIQKMNLDYISLNAFATILDYGIYTNSSKKKTVLYVGREKATFTAGNTFIILNDHVYQFLYKPIWYESELWLPAKLLERVFSRYTTHQMNYDPVTKTFTIGQKDVNISNVDISSKDNGTLITVYSSKKFSDQDITLKVANGWLHVEVYGGKADAETLTKQKTAGVVSDLQVIQFDTLVSLAFRLKKPVIEKEVVLSPHTTDFLVNLRTKETIEEDQQTKQELERQKKEWLVDTIVLDPGHGGKDPGAVGYRKLYEKTIVLNVALQLGKIIKKNMPTVKVVYTRNKDVFIPLWKRTQIANEKRGKLFISLHCNSSRNSRVRGFETYFLSSDEDKNKQAQEVVLKENASIEFEAAEDRQRYEGINFILATMAQNAFIKQSQYLASTIQKTVIKKMNGAGLKDRGVKQGRFWVMVGATMPNVLIEMGYISNKTEAKLLKKKSTANSMAQAIYAGIEKYKTDVESAI